MPRGRPTGRSRSTSTHSGTSASGSTMQRVRGSQLATTLLGSRLLAQSTVAPTLTTLSATPIPENGVTTLSGTIADVGTLDTFTVEIDWDNDGLVDETHTGLPAGGFSYTHKYLDDDPTGTAVDDMPICVTVTDDDLARVDGQTTVQVSNVAPTLTTSRTPIPENGVTTLSGTIADVGTLDTFTVRSTGTTTGWWTRRTRVCPRVASPTRTSTWTTIRPAPRWTTCRFA